jgi:hypothetical protein
VLAEALTAAGGTAVVQAAGTDAWAGFRGQVAKWFGRGDASREHSALERLDEAAAALKVAGPDGSEMVHARQEAAWQTRFETLMEGLDGDEQQRAAAELRSLLDGLADHRAAAVGQNAVAITGDVTIHAQTGGVAAWRMGSVQTGHPPGEPSGTHWEAVDPHQPGRSSG